jgi:hypothetical protein
MKLSAFHISIREIAAADLSVLKGCVNQTCSVESAVFKMSILKTGSSQVSPPKIRAPYARFEKQSTG